MEDFSWIIYVGVLLLGIIGKLFNSKKKSDDDAEKVDTTYTEDKNPYYEEIPSNPYHQSSDVLTFGQDLVPPPAHVDERLEKLSYEELLTLMTEKQIKDRYPNKYYD